MKWYLKVWKQYADFSGRARRKEFWMFTLFNMIIVTVAGGIAALLVIMGISTLKTWMPIIGYILLAVLSLYYLAIFIPSLAISVRRLHDIGKSGWWFLIVFVPLVGWIVLIIFFLFDSQPSANKWGTNPKEREGTRPYNQTIQTNRHFPQLQCKVGYDHFIYKIVTPRTTIGRERDNDLILNHTTVSRYHAEILSAGGSFEIIDKGSTNRVIVNGQFFQRATLRDGDIIGLGETVITFYV